MQKKFVGVCIAFILTSTVTKGASVDEPEGLSIAFNRQAYLEATVIEPEASNVSAIHTKAINITGSLVTFVNCGSQYAIWSQFPQVIRYALTDLDTYTVYQSVDNELSISWQGNSVYERYAKKPCDQLVTKNFSVNLQDVYFIDPPKNRNKNKTTGNTKSINVEISNFTLQAYYLAYKSKPLLFNETPLTLKGY